MISQNDDINAMINYKEASSLFSALVCKTSPAIGGERMMAPQGSDSVS